MRTKDTGLEKTWRQNDTVRKYRHDNPSEKLEEYEVKVSTEFYSIQFRIMSKNLCGHKQCDWIIIVSKSRDELTMRR